MPFHVDSEVGAAAPGDRAPARAGAHPADPAERRRPALRRRDVGPARAGGARRLRREAARTRASRSTCSHDLLAQALDAARCPRVRPGRAHHRDPVRARAGRAAGRAGRPDAGRPAGRGARSAACSSATSTCRRDLQPAAGVPRTPTTSCSRRCPTTCSSGTTPPGSTTACRSTRWQAGAQAGDDQLPAGLQLPPDVPRRPACTSTTATTTRHHDPANCEGGDILVIGNGAVMIGMGERTSPQGIEFLARQYFAHGAVTKVIAVELPKTRAFMHLDTAMTMIDRDAFSVYPYLPESLAVVHAHAGRHAAATTRSPRTTSCSPSSPRRSGSRRCACCGRRSTCSAPSASSGTTATTSSPSRPASSSATSATPRPTRSCARTASRSSPIAGERTRPRPRRPAVHVLPHRARRRAPDAAVA